jgi:nucleotide-binding universal stress UspA family protein
VHLLEVAPERESERAWDSLKDAGARLEKHGVTSFSQTRPCSHTVAETVQNVALDVSADLIVLGAYGHSRAREWVLGGVTRDLLDSKSIPLLLCH